MESIQNIFKKTAKQMATNFIKKQFPNLADVEFDVDMRHEECPECGELNIGTYWIKRETDKEFMKVPQEKRICTPCEDKRMGIEARKDYKRALSNRVTAQFWNVPPELEKETLSTYGPADEIQAEALSTAIKYYKDFQNGEKYNLFLRGSYGGGKSHLLKGIAEAVRHMGRADEQGDEIPFTVGFLTFETLLGMIKGTFGRRDGQTEDDIIKAVIELDFLVIDDLGTESGEWAGKKLFEIINGRQGKATAYSTNFMDMNELAKRFDINGGKIVSRLHSNTKIVDIVTKDMRIEKTRG